MQNNSYVCGPFTNFNDLAWSLSNGFEFESIKHFNHLISNSTIKVLGGAPTKGEKTYAIHELQQILARQKYGNTKQYIYG